MILQPHRISLVREMHAGSHRTLELLRRREIPADVHAERHRGCALCIRIHRDGDRAAHHVHVGRQDVVEVFFRQPRLFRFAGRIAQARVAQLEMLVRARPRRDAPVYVRVL